MYIPVQIVSGNADQDKFMDSTKCELNTKFTLLDNNILDNQIYGWAPVSLGYKNSKNKVGLAFSSTTMAIEYFNTHFSTNSVYVYRIRSRKEVESLIDYYTSHNVYTVAMDPPVRGGPTHIFEVKKGLWSDMF